MSQPSSQLPRPVRAALGLVATALDNARSFPEKAIEMPVLAVSAALQFSLRAQQRYAELTTRGDDLVGRLRGLPDEPPEWATFDETPADAPAETPDGSARAASTSAATTRDTRSAPSAKAAPSKRTRAPAKTAKPAKTPATAKTPAPARPTKRAKPAKPARSERGAKSVRRPRTGRPSAFDAVNDERSEATGAAERSEPADPAQHGETPGAGERSTG